MMKKMNCCLLLSLVLLLFTWMAPLTTATTTSFTLPVVYAQSNTFGLTVDGDDTIYEINYTVDAKVLAMEIDQELNSLLIGLENTRDSIFSIHLPDNVISAENDQFVVFVNLVDTDYTTMDLQPSTINEPDHKTTVLEFFVPQGTLEVEIVGTHTIPEFPTITLTLAIIMMISIIIMSSRYNNNNHNYFSRL